MKDIFLVCDYGPGIPELIKGFPVVFYGNSFSVLDSLKKDIQDSDIHIHCVVVKTKFNLSEIDFDEKWCEYPLAIEAPAIGRIYKFLGKTPVIRKLNVRFYLSTKEPSCYKDIRILSSLGYSTSIIIEGNNTNWIELKDLMTYALLNARKHAEIHPFNYVNNYYHPHHRTNFDSVYFNDPERYLHIDRTGKLYLKREHCLKGENSFSDIHTLNDYKEQPAYINERNRWFDFFLEPTTCACCKGWRICLGKYSENIDSNPGCVAFFSEFLDNIDVGKRIHDTKNQLAELWQP